MMMMTDETSAAAAAAWCDVSVLAENSLSHVLHQRISCQDVQRHVIVDE